MAVSDLGLPPGHAWPAWDGRREEISPGGIVPIVETDVGTGSWTTSAARWGARIVEGRRPAINARLERIASFWRDRGARRALIPASHVFEWRRQRGGRAEKMKISGGAALMWLGGLIVPAGGGMPRASTSQSARARPQLLLPGHDGVEAGGKDGARDAEVVTDRGAKEDGARDAAVVVLTRAAMGRLVEIHPRMPLWFEDVEVARGWLRTGALPQTRVDAWALRARCEPLVRHQTRRDDAPPLLALMSRGVDGEDG